MPEAGSGSVQLLEADPDLARGLDPRRIKEVSQRLFVRAIDAPRGPWAPWGAILLTSLVFAVFHETWTIPLIFLLSIAFGYAYERTGNLYVPMTIHFVVNATNTALVFFGLEG